MKKYNQAIILIVIIYVILNKHFFNVLIKGNTKNFFWILKILNRYGIKKPNKIYKYTKENSIEKYFNTFEKNQIHKDLIMPLFNNVIYINKYDGNYSNPTIFGKNDSISSKINNITTPYYFTGDSIFRIDYEKRGNNNLLKKEYLKALLPQHLKIYRKKINNYFENVNLDETHNLYAFINKTTKDLLYLTHFSELPTDDELDDIELFLESIIKSTFSFNYTFTELRHIYNLKFFINKTFKRIEKCQNENKVNMVCIWLKETIFTKEDIFIEFIHNIIGLVVNWTNLTYTYLLDLHNKKIPKYDKKYDMNQYTLENFSYICPDRFVGSKLKNPEHLEEKNNNIAVLHELKITTRNTSFFGKETEKFNLDRMKDYQSYMSKDKKESKNNISKCPFHKTISSATVPNGLSIYENKGYMPFGDGYRRCPGEHLSIIYLEELIHFLDNKKFNIFHRGKTNLEHFIWDRIDKSLYISF